MDIDRHWYRSSYTWLTFLLAPFSWLFHLVIIIRRALYHLGIKKTYHFPVPVVVVGNITVGGTGKTPFVVWLAACLKAQGWRPGIVSRGAGGKESHTPRFVDGSSDPGQVGDEAVLLARRTLCTLVVCADRVAAVNALLARADCNIVISDDGLQHYRLGRDVEIIIVDGDRGFGNRCLLPAGPLRESVSRLKKADFIIAQGQSMPGMYGMQLRGNEFVSVSNPAEKKPIESFKNLKVHGVAAIGNPERFFASLRQLGMEVVPHRFPDHYLYEASDIDFGDELPVIMTEKDAVKCSRFSDQRHWCLPVDAVLSGACEEAIVGWVERFLRNPTF